MNSFIRLKISSFYNDLLDKFVGELASVVFNSSGSMNGPIPLPTRTKRFVINRSTHVNKKSREVYYIHYHSRLVCIKSSGSASVLQAIQAVAIPPGIGVDIRIIDSE